MSEALELVMKTATYQDALAAYHQAFGFRRYVARAEHAYALNAPTRRMRQHGSYRQREAAERRRDMRGGG